MVASFFLICLHWSSLAALQLVAPFMHALLRVIVSLLLMFCSGWFILRHCSTAKDCSALVYRKEQSGSGDERITHHLDEHYFLSGQSHIWIDPWASLSLGTTVVVHPYASPCLLLICTGRLSHTEVFCRTVANWRLGFTGQCTNADSSVRLAESLSTSADSTSAPSNFFCTVYPWFPRRISRSYYKCSR